MTINEMNHLIRAMRDCEVSAAREALTAAHRFLVERGSSAARGLAEPGPSWGCAAKRIAVDLRGSERPSVITKDEEALVEVINMTATVERLLAVFVWLERIGPNTRVVVCHPTTSSSGSARNETDLVATREDGTRLLVEVCDVTSTRAASNQKEKKTLAALGCVSTVPADGAQRFVATSREYARALAGEKRRWAGLHYRYRSIADLDGGTTLLRVESTESAANTATADRHRGRR